MDNIFSCPQSLMRSETPKMLAHYLIFSQMGYTQSQDNYKNTSSLLYSMTITQT
jgi:hypothetical protein